MGQPLDAYQESGKILLIRRIVPRFGQRKLLNMQFDGFFRKLTTGKWAKIAKCSTDTALNDIRDLVAKGVLRKTEEGGRSTNYLLTENT